MARRARALAEAAPAAAFPTLDRWLPPASRGRVAAWRPERNRPVVLGRIDNDGRVRSFCGPLPGFPEIDEAGFVERYRYDLDVVAIDDAVLIRKDYRGDREAFLREWLSLAALGGASCAPALHHVDEARSLLYKSLVPGPTLRQRLVEAGARILSHETESDPELARLTPYERLEAVWARGREVLTQALGEDFRDRLESRLEVVHRRGVTGFSLTFGNVVIHETDGQPYFIDFDAAHTHRRAGGFLFSLRRNRDREVFHEVYGTAGPRIPTVKAFETKSV